MLRFVRAVRRAAALIIGAVATAASAGPLVIAPTTVAIESGRHGALVSVENASDEPVDLQFRAYDWDQVGGQDRLAPADGLIVSPAIATVPAHGRQVFRVLQTGPAPAPGAPERAWRLRLNELPRPGAAAVAVNLEFLLPVFQGAADAAPRLAWRWEPDGRVTVTNAGNRRARLTRLALSRPGGPAVDLAGAAATYLLSGASRTFAPAAGRIVPAGATLIATGDAGTLDAAPVAVAAR